MSVEEQSRLGFSDSFGFPRRREHEEVGTGAENVQVGFQFGQTAIARLPKSKDTLDDVEDVFRWRIEEYFRCKKTVFEFENFRVRSLKAINALNFYMTVCMAYLAFLSLKPSSCQIRCNVIDAADPIKEHVFFLGYRFAAGIARILGFAHEGCKGWFKPTRKKYCQLSFL